MKVATTFERLTPTTVDGHIIKVTTYYSSFNKDEIDLVQEDLRKTIGTGVVTKFVFNIRPDNMSVISQERINKMWRGKEE